MASGLEVLIPCAVLIPGPGSTTKEMCYSRQVSEVLVSLLLLFFKKRGFDKLNFYLSVVLGESEQGAQFLLLKLCLSAVCITEVLNDDTYRMRGHAR